MNNKRLERIFTVVWFGGLIIILFVLAAIVLGAG
jgi:hypothetical protein